MMRISPNRMTGLATGMDTESMVKQMMKPYQMRMDKLKQDRQMVQWRQDLYRAIIGNVNTYKRNYFDSLQSDKYMLSSNSIAAFNVAGLTDNSLNVRAGATAKTGNYEVSVDKLAETAKLEGASPINTVVAGVPNYGIKIDGNNNTFTVDGIAVSLDIDSVNGYNKYSSLSELASAINNKMAATDIDEKHKLSDTTKAVVKNDSIQFMQLVNLVEDKTVPENSNNKITVNYAGKDYEVTLSAGKYTADELAASINSRLPWLKSTDGSTTFPADKTITAVTTGTGTSFQIDGSPVSVKDGKNAVINPIAKTISSDNTKPEGNTDSVITDGISLKYENEIIQGFNDTLNIRVGTETKSITLKAGITNIDDLIADINTKLGSTEINLAGKLTVSKSTDETKIVFNSTSGDQISFYGNASSVVGGYDNFEVNMSGRTKVSELSQFTQKQVDFVINGKEFKYDFNGADKDKTIDEIINDINSKAGVNISYSTATKKFSIASNETGASATLSFQDKSGTANFLETIFGSSSINKSGQDAQVTIKGPDGTSSTYLKPKNVFEVDGVTYTLNAKPTETIKFSLTQNIDDSFNKIKAFVEDYNKLMISINDQISEKRQYKYLPLTDEQKKDMKENDIALWEGKAKEGLIRNDSDLTNMLRSLRMTFFDGVEGVGLSIKDIGLDTSSDYTENGKIIIDEEKLREALKTNGDKVSELLTKKSPSYPRYDGAMSSADRTTRYNEEGIFQRISDVLEDYTRTTSGKGILLNKAGIKGDFTDKNNILSEDLKKRDKNIEDMEDKLFERENNYYLQFARLEKAMQQINSQASWIAQQFGGGQG